MTENTQVIHPRKMQITEAAVRCFLEGGYHQTGMRDIAERARVSLGNLYNHFKGKEAILGFIADLEGQELDAFVEMLGQQGSPRRALEAFIEAYGRYAAKPENALLGIEVLCEALRNEQIAEVFGRNRRRLVGALEACLRAGADAGELAASAREPAAAEMILDVLEGSGLRALTEQQNRGALHALLMRAVLA